MVTLKEHNSLMECMAMVSDKMRVNVFLALVGCITPSLIFDERILMSHREEECVGFYAPSIREPIGMAKRGNGVIKLESVKEFQSRDAATMRCNQRDMNDMSCCTMPVVTTVDAINSKGITSYIYKESVTQRIYMIYNADIVRIESCLPTSFIWRETSTICPPSVTQLMLEKADAAQRELTFGKKYVSKLYESILTTGSSCHESTLLPCSAEGEGKSTYVHRDVANKWISNNELIPTAPANLFKLFSDVPPGDVMASRVPSLSATKDQYVIPTSESLRQMDYVILVLHPDGSMEVAKEKTGGEVRSQRSALARETYRLANHLKVLVYGTMRDYVNKVPKPMASVLDM